MNYVRKKIIGVILITGQNYVSIDNVKIVYEGIYV